MCICGGDNPIGLELWASQFRPFLCIVVCAVEGVASNECILLAPNLVWIQPKHEQIQTCGWRDIATDFGVLGTYLHDIQYSLPHHNSPENRVSGARRATPQDSSQVFHKTVCIAPSSSVLDNTSPIKLAVCQGGLLAGWRHSVRSLRTLNPPH